MQKSFGYYILRFLISLIGICAVLYGATFLLAEFAPDFTETFLTSPALIGAAFAIFILPPMQTGQSFYHHEGRTMTGREGWGLAAITALIFTGAIMAFAYAGFSRDPQRMAELEALWGEDWMVALIPMVIFAVLLMVIFRLFFWASIRGRMKQAARAEKAS